MGRRQEPAAIYTDLRSRALSITEAELGELPAAPPVLGVVMDTGYQLGAGEHELSELFYAAQDVLTELRLVEESSA